MRAILSKIVSALTGERARRPGGNRLVFIATHVKFYPHAAGNEIRIHHLIRHLKEVGYAVAVLYCPLDGVLFTQEEVRALAPGLVDHLYQVGSEERLQGAGSRVYLRLLAEQEPVLQQWRSVEDSFFPCGAVVKAAKLLGELRPEIVIAQYIWTSSLLKLAPHALKVVDLHDKYSDKAAKVCAYGIEDFAPSEAEEIAFLDRADVAIAIQPDEARRYRQLKPRAKVVTAGLDFATVELPPPPVDAKTVLIVASGNPLNVSSVQHFIDNVWGSVVSAVPEARLRVAGAVGKALCCREQQHVEIAGYVADLQQEYAGAVVVINPVVAGTGLKIKSLEALAHGKALVSTPAGVEGLPNREGELFLVGHDDRQFAALVQQLLTDAASRSRLEQAALAYGRNDLSPGKVYAALDAALQPWKIRTLCLFLRYGIEGGEESLARLEKWYRDKMPGSAVTIWIVDNKIEGSVDTVDPSGHRLLSGDNVCWEFSGWQRILDLYADDIAEAFDVVHFVTDKFTMLYTGYLEHFREDQLRAVVDSPVCLGHIDCYDDPVVLEGAISSSWIRTCFFFMSARTFSRVGSLMSYNDTAVFFDGGVDFRPGAPLDERYRQLITSWLNGEELQGVSWHSTITDTRHFQLKALAILNEHALSIRLRDKGINLIDFCWMHYSSLKASSGFLTAPWEDQLALRKKVLQGEVKLP